MTVRDTTTQAVEQVKGAVEQVQRWRPVRVVQRYIERGGPLLGAGMSYQSLFALFAAIWVGFAIAGIWVRSDKALYDQLIDIINSTIPGLIGKKGVITPAALDSARVTLKITALVALAGLAWTALGWLSSTRTAIRTMFLLGNDPRNFFVQKAVDAGEALVFGVGLIVSALISVITHQLLDFLLTAAGRDPNSTVGQIGGNAISVLVVFVINLATLLAMYRVLSQLYIPWRNLFVGSALGAAALSILSQLSGQLLHGASRNPLFSSFVALVGLLIWLNFICAVILLGAAWIAVGMEDRGLSARRMTAAELELARRRAEFRAELDSAREAVRQASVEFESARGLLKRRRARGVLLRALRRLRSVSRTDPDLTGAEQLDTQRLGAEHIG